MSELASLRVKMHDALTWAKRYRLQAETGICAYTIKGEVLTAETIRLRRRMDRETAAKLLHVVAPSIRRKIASEKAWYCNLPLTKTDGKPNPYRADLVGGDGYEDRQYETRRSAA